MILKQFYLSCLAHASYLVGDERTHAAVVVDPQRDVDQYLAFAAEHGLDIRHVVLTHFHADFLAGHLELRDRTGARIYLGAAAQAEYEFTALHDGDTIELGRVRLAALETPGHTAESISMLVFDLEQSSDKPYAVLTGDTLFIGDVGRPDLRVALGWSAADLGGLLYDSMRCWRCKLTVRSCWTRGIRLSSAPRIWREASTSGLAASTPRGPARFSAASSRSSSSPILGVSANQRCGSVVSASITWSAICRADWPASKAGPI